MNAAEIEREKGIRRVSGANKEWLDETEAMLESRLKGSGFRMTGEDIRMYIGLNGGSEPTHYNAWGALIRRLYSHGLIVSTGVYCNRRLKQSHASRSLVWRWE